MFSTSIVNIKHAFQKQKIEFYRWRTHFIPLIIKEDNQYILLYVEQKIFLNSLFIVYFQNVPVTHLVVIVVTHAIAAVKGKVVFVML